jgi:hypothetical protein
MPKAISRSELLEWIRGFVAADAIGVTSLRGQRKRTRKAVLEFLEGMPLSKIARRSREAFREWLDKQTERLRRQLPGRPGPWGVARKALNLYLRSCVYNHFLRKAHRLVVIEPWLEVPLDSIVANSIREQAEDGTLPRWPGLKHLTPRGSRRFQEEGAALAKGMRVPALVFLDNVLWVANR